MTDLYPPSTQRAALIEFAHAIESAASAFRRDECGDPRINGSRGHVYAAPVAGKLGYQLYVVCRSPRVT
jgi:hypothetical protein